MNRLLIITTCFQNTLASFLNRHLAMIKSFRKTKTWSCTQHSAVTSHPEHMERKWHHSVTWSRSSGTPKQAFYSTPFTHRETFRLRRFSTLLLGAPANFEDSPHTQEWVIFDGTPTICGEFGYVYGARPWKHRH